MRNSLAPRPELDEQRFFGPLPIGRFRGDSECRDPLGAPGGTGRLTTALLIGKG